MSVYLMPNVLAFIDSCPRFKGYEKPKQEKKSKQINTSINIFINDYKVQYKGEEWHETLMHSGLHVQ